MTANARTGAHILAEMLSKAGVEIVFSVSGNQIMPVYDALLDTRIRIVHVRHEAAAVAMADRYAQVTGGTGIALVTAGPGFANALSPLFAARAAESPVLLLSGDSPVAQDGTGAFQELRQQDVSAPLVKVALRPHTPGKLREDIAKAFALSVSGRPGPVHIALPFDVLTAQAVIDSTDSVAIEPPTARLPVATAGRLLDRLLTAERPLVLTGPRLRRGGADRAADRLEEALGIPVVCMESPRGLRDPALGAFGEMMAQSDLVALVGKKADFSVGFLKPGAVAPDASFICIDAEEEVIDQLRGLCGGRLVDAAVADVSAAVEDLVRAGRTHRNCEWCRSVKEAIDWRGDHGKSGKTIHPALLCKEIQALLDEAEDPILVCDGGEFGQWAQACCRAPTRIVNGPSGAIGWGLCHAIAAKLARPEATVVAVMGDGTAGFHLAEFETAVRVGANIIAVVGNDSRWNAEYQIQLRDYGADRTVGCELSHRARYDLAAAAFGCHGEFVDGIAGLAGAMARAQSSGRPACINVMIEGMAAPVFSRDRTGAAGVR